MKAELKNLIAIAGAALKEEDTSFLNDVAKNRQAYPDGRGGILRFNNEHYYKFVVARALVKSYPLAIAIEVDSHDMVLYHPNSTSRFGAVEMKRWMGASGEQEIPGILRDIEKLRDSEVENALMLIFAENRRGDSGSQLGWLSKRLGLCQVEDQSLWERYLFPTLNPQGNEVEFCVAGYEL